MKTRKLLLFYGILVVSVLIWSGYAGGLATVGGQGRTSAPGDNMGSCFSCHNSGSYGQANQNITVKDAMGLVTTEYTPGQTYEVSIMISAAVGTPSGYGFQACVLDGNDLSTGTFQNLASNVKTKSLPVSGNTRVYVEQNGISSGTFVMDWVAPATDVGDVKFYYVGNCVNGNGGTSGDIGGEGTNFTLTPATACPPITADGSFPLGTTTYAGETVTSTGGFVPPGGNVTFIGETEITINPTFEVLLGAVFSAEIDATPCN